MITTRIQNKKVKNVVFKMGLFNFYFKKFSIKLKNIRFANFLENLLSSTIVIFVTSKISTNKRQND